MSFFLRKGNQESSTMLLSFYNYLFSRQAPATVRNYSTNNPTLSPKVVDNFHPRLKTIFQQLDAIAPRFALKEGEVEVLSDPREFYSTLKSKISKAKSRIFLSSLYFGKRQRDLLYAIEKALEENEDLKVYILIDVLRGTRESPSPCSAHLLVELVEKFGKRVDVRMYHTPHLTGLKKTLAPKRANETWGLQHMKLYGFDDEIFLTGANLSGDYFSDRQDRYYLFKSQKLSDYYFEIHSAVASLSYQLLESWTSPEGYRLDWPTSNKSCEPHVNHERFISDSSFLLEPLLKQQKLSSFDEFEDTNDYDTIVYAVSQFTPLFHPQNDASTEKPAILRILSFLDSPKIKWWFTAGYFNMLPEIKERLVNGSAQGTVITAAPQANSFYKSSGISYYLPEAYLLLAKKFLEELVQRGKDTLIKVYEWKRGIVNTESGWSYHAKGIWITVPEENEPTVTIVGSSNYTKRAYQLDLESDVILITKDKQLKSAMRSELQNLMKDVEELNLSDFEAQPVPQPASVGDDGQTLESTPKYEIKEDRKISRKVQIALTLLGDKL